MFGRARGVAYQTVTSGQYAVYLAAGAAKEVCCKNNRSALQKEFDRLFKTRS